MPSAIDPTFIADGTPVSKPAFRDQLLTLRAELEHGGFVTNPVTLAESTASQALADVHSAAAMPAVGTIAELQAIPPTPGRVIEVLGYHAPGDGGGGLFYADPNGALQTDGGVVFGHSADETAEQVEAGKLAGNFNAGFTLPQANVVFGSVSISFAANSSLVITDLDLHGHTSGGNSGAGIIPYFDHASGAFRANPGIGGYLTTKATTATVRYKSLTNARRWVRVTDGRVMDVRWFGLTGTGDERNQLCWALSTAKRLGFREVRLNGEYRYLGPIELPANVEFGWGKLKVVDDDALRHLRADYATAFPDGFAVELHGGESTMLGPEDNSPYWALRNLELDGNYEGNTFALENPSQYTQDGGLENVLQNTPTWAGVAAYNHGGRVIPEGQKAVLTDVHIHGYGSNCIVGHGNTIYSGRNVRVGNSARNHVFYSIKGEFTNFTCYGFAWAVYGKTEHVTFYGLRFEDLQDFPFTAPWGSTAPVLIMYEGLGWRSAPETSHRYQRVGFNVIGGHWELADWPGIGPLVFGDGHHLTIQDLVILGPTTGSGETPFLQRAATTASLAEDWTLRNVTILNRNGRRLGLLGNNDPLAVVFTMESLSVGYLQGYESTGNSASWLRLLAGPKLNGMAANYPRRMVLERVTNTMPNTCFQVAVTDANATPIEVTVRDSTLRFANAKVFRNESGTGNINGLTVQDLDKIKVFFDTTRFEFQTGGESFGQAELFFALTRFRGCTTFDGLVSEQGGTIAATASPTVVSTSLLWAPEVVRILPMSSGLTDIWVEIFDSTNTTPIASAADKRSPKLRIHHTGSSGMLAWEAAVRPY